MAATGGGNRHGDRDAGRGRPDPLMQGIRRVFRLGLLRRRDVEAEVDEELAFHLAMREQRLRERGMSPADARDAAQSRFGSLETIRAECLAEDEAVARTHRVRRLTHDLRNDARFALRALRKAPLFTAAVVATLGIGIGATAAVLSIVRGVLLEPVTGVHEASRLFEARDVASYPVFRELERQAAELSVAAISERSFAVRVADVAQHRLTALVSGNFLAATGVRAALGRTLLPEDDVTGASPVAVLSHAFWRSAYGGDSSIIGRVVHVNDAPHTVVGVLHEDFRGIHLGSSPVLWIPLAGFPAVAPSAARAEAMRTNNWQWLRVVGRLPESSTLSQAHQQLAAIAHAAAPDDDKQALTAGLALRSIQAAALPPGARGGAALFLTVLSGVVLLVLLTACANITGLLLARTATRARELAVRMALGAGRARLARLLMMEALLLSVAGGIAAILVHEGVRAALAAVPLPGGIPGSAVHLPLDLPLLLAFGTLVLLCALLIGVVPALHGVRAGGLESLRGATTTTSRRSGRLRGILVGSQVAIALVLLVGMGLFARALQTGLGVDLGFATEGRLTMNVNMGSARLSLQQEQQYMRDVAERLEAQPGVVSASWTSSLPLTNDTDRSRAVIAGYVPSPDERVAPEMNLVEPSYHSTMGIPIVLGREFDNTDVSGNAPGVVVNETLVSRYLANREPLGASIEMLGETFRIIGVARNAKYHALQEEPIPYVYFNGQQRTEGDPRSFAILVVRTSTDASTMLQPVLRRVQSVHPGVAVFGERTLESRVNEVLAPQIAGSVLLGGFGVIALAVSLIGVYAMVAFAVSQRRREFGLRLALGARPGAVVRMVVLSIARFVLVGIGAGIVIALAAAPFLESFLIGVTPTDAVTFATIGVVLAAVCLAASYLPARRVVQIEPLEALRQD